MLAHHEVNYNEYHTRRAISTTSLQSIACSPLGITRIDSAALYKLMPRTWWWA